jgi:hypothetical protein
MNGQNEAPVISQPDLDGLTKHVARVVANEIRRREAEAQAGK